MKNSYKITISAVFSALAVVIMLISYFPYLTYAIPAIAGLCVMVVLVETDYKWAFFSYIVSAVLIFLFGEMESKLMYVFLFGYYPILKGIIEKINIPVLEWIIKIFVLNIAVLLVYGLLANVFGISDQEFMKYGTVILLALANIVFVVYDIAVTRMSMVYLYKLHPTLKKLFKKGS